MERSKSLAGIVVETRKQESGPPIGKPIHIQLASRQPALIPPAVDKIRAHLETMSGLKDIEDSRPISGIEWEINVDRAQTAKFGADIAMLVHGDLTSRMKINVLRTSHLC